MKGAYEEINKMKLDCVEPGMQVLSRPSMEDEKDCYDFGRNFAVKVKEYHGQFS